MPFRCVIITDVPPRALLSLPEFHRLPVATYLLLLFVEKLGPIRDSLHTRKGLKMSTAKVDVDGLIDEGREKLNDFADRGMDYVSSANSVLTDFIRDEPLIAIASAFAVGYVAARILNRVTGR